MKQKTTGIVRKIDDLGRIVLPAEMRRALDLSVQDPVEIRVEGNQIILRKHTSACAFCGASRSLVSFRGKYVCPSCIKELSSI